MINMVKYLLGPALIFFIIISFSDASAQQAHSSVKYIDAVFEKVLVTKNLAYNLNPPAGVNTKYYRFDFYEPAADSCTARPLIIWLHGGGFKFGKKTSGGLPLWSKTFALRGYVCAALNYRLSKKHPLKHFEDLVEGCADAVDDLHSAIQFFKQHSSQYRIDTNRIIVGGNSAGGMIALQAVYGSRPDMARLIRRGDSTTAAVYNPQHIAAVINYWGALFNAHWLRHARVPIVSVHGSQDGIVPYDDNKPPLLGSLAIHRLADSLQIPNRLKIFKGYAHELQKHFNPFFAGHGAKERWLTAGQFTAVFLYEHLFR